MGRDVMSRSVRARYAVSTSPSPSARDKSLDPDKSMSDGGPFNKSLTPNRKHHKLLKDGSEVWSEEVEKVFVQGLKQYWESPWATYSRGRSRWRNQFLVEHLKKNGIERSKKQVASHIQVLRNMWRGEPEFHLVAGGEELFQENGLLAPSHSPDARGHHAKLPLSEPITPSASADFPPVPEFAPQSLPSLASLPPCGPSSLARTGAPFGSSAPLYAGASSSLAAALGTPPPSPHADRIRAPITLEPLHMGTGLFTLPSSSGGGAPGGYLSAADTAVATYTGVPQPHNRVLSLSLWAEGMPVCALDVDRLAAQMALPPHSPQLPSILLRTRVALPGRDDMRAPAGLHGVHGAVTFAARWAAEAKCITTLYAGQTAVRQEIGYLDGHETAHIHAADALTAQAVTCELPESTLSSCRWLEPGQDLITQQIVIDGVVLAAFVYHLDTAGVPRGVPSAELIGIQRYRPTVRRRTTSQPAHHHHHHQSHHHQQFTPPRSPGPAMSSYFPTPTPSYATPLLSHAHYGTTLARPPSSVGGGVPAALELDMYSTPASMYGTKSPALTHYYPGAAS